jgi:hypothetical protein
VKITGGCLCGAVRYSTDAAPLFQAVCHCKNCQKQGGTALSIVVGFPAAAFSIEGDVKTYEDKGESGGTVYRRFCPECGSPIVSDVSSMAGVTILKAGTLDDTSWLKPGMQVWTKSAQPWVGSLSELPGFSTTPGA